MRRANGRPLRLLLLDTALAVGQRGQLLVLQGKIEDGIPLLRQALKGAARSTLRNAQYRLYL